MSSAAITTQWVMLPSPELSIPAYLAQPTQATPCPGILVFQEIFGVNDHIRSIVERLAEAGYVAIAPCLFQRQVDRFEVGYSPAETTLGREYKVQTQAAELLADAQAAIAYLEAMPTVKAGAIGTLGFCFGGHVAYLAATLPAVKATASFYGAGIATLTPGGGPPTLTRTPEIQGIVYAFFGTQDPLIPVAEIDQIEATLTAHREAHRVFRYPTDHGFFCDQRASYQAEAAADAWRHVLALFARLGEL